MYYKRYNNDEWRCPGKVIGRDGKVVIVKQGGSLREITRVHMTRLGGKKEVTFLQHFARHGSNREGGTSI